MSGLLEPFDREAKGHDPAAVAALSGRGPHPARCAAQEHPSFVGSNRGLDVEHELVGLALLGADQTDAHLHEAATGDRELDEVAAEAVELVDPNLIE